MTADHEFNGYYEAINTYICEELDPLASEAHVIRTRDYLKHLSKLTQELQKISPEDLLFSPSSENTIRSKFSCYFRDLTALLDQEHEVYRKGCLLFSLPHSEVIKSRVKTDPATATSNLPTSSFESDMKRLQASECVPTEPLWLFLQKWISDLTSKEMILSDWQEHCFDLEPTTLRLYNSAWMSLHTITTDSLIYLKERYVLS